MILGKVNLTEFAAYVSNSQQSATARSAARCSTRTTVEPTPAAQLGGSGVAAAAGLAALTIGSDSEGSIISPASQNGVVGIRPTTGLWSRNGVVPISEWQDTLGPLTQTVSDAGAAAERGHRPSIPTTRAPPTTARSPASTTPRA